MQLEDSCIPTFAWIVTERGRALTHRTLEDRVLEKRVMGRTILVLFFFAARQTFKGGTHTQSCTRWQECNLNLKIRKYNFTLNSQIRLEPQSTQAWLWMRYRRASHRRATMPTPHLARVFSTPPSATSFTNRHATSYLGGTDKKGRGEKCGGVDDAHGNRKVRQAMDTIIPSSPVAACDSRL